MFDRSWYGRVLVERVEGFATKAEWSRAYDQIVEFERGLCVEGMVLVKFWMHISEEEQLRRFEAREHNRLKSWKLTDEDWRNREKHKLYVRAVEDMLRQTDHPAAPWHLIAGDSKRYARVAVIEAVIAALEQGLRDDGQEPLARRRLVQGRMQLHGRRATEGSGGEDAGRGPTRGGDPQLP